MPPAPEFPYANGGRLLRQTLDALLPPRRISVAEHAEAHRWVRAPAGSHLERWDHRTAPYLVEPMEALTDEAYDTVVLVGPGACGKTMVAENWLLQSVEADPADLLWYLHTDPALRAYVQGRIEPMLEAHDRLIGSLRYGRDSVELKRFRGMRAEFLAFTASNLVNKHVARIVVDEPDSCDEAHGDVKAAVDPRRQAAGDASKLLVIGHPDRGLPVETPRDRQRGIMALYADSDRRTPWWACPHCNGYSSPNPGTSRRMVCTWDVDAPLDVIQAEAVLECPLCGTDIVDEQRRLMLPTIKWVRQGEEIGEDGRITGQRVARRTAGFWVTGLMSPFVKDGIGGLARARAAAERESLVEGDDKSLRTVMVKSWGIPYTPPRQVGTIEAQVLADRAELHLVLGVVPEGVRVLTVAVDNQGNRFELVTRGWGEGLESWVVDFRVIPADPATSPEDWDKLLRLLAGLEYPLADGSGRVMRPRCSIFDAVGQPGVTAEAYAAWRRARRAGLVRRLGLVNGREVWNIMPSRGASAPQAAALVVSLGDGERKDRKASAGRGDVPLLVFNPNTAKDALAAQLARAEAGPGAVHFPAALRSAAPPHLWFEQLAAENRDARRGTWSKSAGHLRNEAWDLLVMTAVAARLVGLHRIPWDRAPAWAAPWGTNALVRKPEPAPAPEAAVAATAVALGALLRGQPVPVPRAVAVPPVMLARSRGVRSAGVSI